MRIFKHSKQSKNLYSDALCCPFSFVIIVNELSFFSGSAYLSPVLAVALCVPNYRMFLP